MSRVALLVFILILKAIPCLADQEMGTITHDGCTVNYRVKCPESYTPHPKKEEWAILTLTSSTGSNKQPASTTITLEGLLNSIQCKPVTLLLEKKPPVSALVITGDGHTSEWTSVVKVDTKNLTRSLVIFNQHHSGKSVFRFNEAGQLAGISAPLLALHEVDDQTFPDHVMLKRNYRWSSQKQAFVADELQPDTEAEARLTLLDLLQLPGSRRLGVTWYCVGEAGKSFYRFKPTGLLRDKLPPGLKDASFVEVVVGDKLVKGEHTSYVVSIREVTEVTR